MDYALEGPRWGTGPVGSAGGVITWAIDATVPASFLADITAAFARWSAFGNIQFTQVSSTATAMIDFSLEQIDGLNGVLGLANYYYSGSKMISSEIEFDAGEGWHSVSGHMVSSSGVNFYPVALHEIGHAIGLDHYNAVPAIMNAFLTRDLSDLTSSDINGIQALYGASQTASSGDWLVNSNFYFGAHPGAANSGLTAAAHYNSIGWHQNYDPNAFFSTAGYLAANADVRSAGVNPLQHFDQNGWREGRDPSANFDTSLYLEHNPDVRAAGIDPLTHYLQYGLAEGRQAYTAVGQAGSFTNGSFDPEYYLLSNPDVAQAAIAAGGNSFAFARTHFETYGWREGRNPDAFFDTKGYLQAYADVRAAGINPLTHYDQYGWREGRDPSGAFDTDQYLSHYTDVAAAHIDPLQHYLSYGIHEARLPFSDWLIS